ncbi:MAG TPA: YjbF family lipoprotein [Rhizomicrobium sp.]
MRRLLAILPVALLLAACSSNSNTDTLKLGQLIYQQLGAAFGGGDVPRERAASIPYASIGVRLGGGPEVMLILTSASGQDLQFLGGGVSITIRGGRIIRTVGLEHNLDAFQGPIPDRADPKTGQTGYHYAYDLVDRNAYGIFVRCTQSIVGEESITIIGVRHDTRHVVEHCDAPQLDWSFDNHFWADKAGIVWKTTQSVHPDLDPLTIQILRPAQG